MLPVTIKQVYLKQLSFLLSKTFLTGLTRKGLGNGVARETYYILNVNGILRIPPNPPVGEYKMLTKMLETAEAKGYTHLMLIP